MKAEGRRQKAEGRKLKNGENGVENRQGAENAKKKRREARFVLSGNPKIAFPTLK